MKLLFTLLVTVTLAINVHSAALPALPEGKTWQEFVDNLVDADFINQAVITEVDGVILANSKDSKITEKDILPIVARFGKDDEEVELTVAGETFKTKKDGDTFFSGKNDNGELIVVKTDKTVITALATKDSPFIAELSLVLLAAGLSVNGF